MKLIIENYKLKDFPAWCGAIPAKNTICERGKSEDFEQLLEAFFPEGITDEQLNDLLSFDDDWVFKQLGIESD